MQALLLGCLAKTLCYDKEVCVWVSFPPTPRLF